MDDSATNLRILTILSFLDGFVNDVCLSILSINLDHAGIRQLLSMHSRVELEHVLVRQAMKGHQKSIVLVRELSHRPLTGKVTGLRGQLQLESRILLAQRTENAGNLLANLNRT